MRTPLPLLFCLALLLIGCVPREKTDLVIEDVVHPLHFGPNIRPDIHSHISRLESDEFWNTKVALEIREPATFTRVRNSFSVSKYSESQANGIVQFRLTLCFRGDANDGDYIKNAYASYLTDDRERVASDLKIRAAFLSDEKRKAEIHDRLKEASTFPRILEAAND